MSVHDVPDGHTHLDLRYLFDGGAMDPAPPAEESQDVHWFAWPAAIAHRRAEPDEHPPSTGAALLAVVPTCRGAKIGGWHRPTAKPVTASS